MAGIWGFTPSDEAANGVASWWNTPIKNRYNILPLAEDARTGKNVWAVPGLLAEPFESLKRVIASGGRTDTTYDDAGVPVSGRGTLHDLDGLNVAGIAPLGTMALGTATGAIERGAMGAGPVRAAEPKGFTAYHGSPHDFDKFDLSKIGTGEGAQAYGHGLYFAENEGVARSYRDQLGNYDNAAVWTGTEPPTQAQQDVLDMLSGYDVARGQAASLDSVERELIRGMNRERLNEGAPGWEPERAARNIERYRERLDALRGMKDKVDVTPPGRMYEVRINADPEQFLDWDKPLSQQSEAVKSSIDTKLAELTGKQITPEFYGSFGESGSGVHNLLSAWSKHRPEGVAGALREAGIPGIRYLDQMSRSAGDGSRNYVLFDDSLVDIMRKYANAPTGAAAPLAISGQGQEQDNMDINALLRSYGLQ